LVGRITGKQSAGSLVQ